MSKIKSFSDFSFFDDIVHKDDTKIAEYEKRQAMLQKEKEYELYKNSGVPSKFYKESFDTFKAIGDDEKYQKTKLEEFASEPKNRILILSGKNGNGKTHLACSVIRKYGGIFRNSSDICIEYESGSDFKAERNKLDILRFYTQQKMLVIDECGKYLLRPDMEKFLLSYIVNNRYENNLPTILVTNCNKKDFIEFLGKATYDRLTEVCMTIDFTGDSYRPLRKSA